MVITCRKRQLRHTEQTKSLRRDGKLAMKPLSNWFSQRDISRQKSSTCGTKWKRPMWNNKGLMIRNESSILFLLLKKKSSVFSVFRWFNFLKLHYDKFKVNFIFSPNKGLPHLILCIDHTGKQYFKGIFSRN